MSGVEYVVIDCEHGSFDFSQLANLVAMGNALDLPIIIRIPSNSSEWILKSLEMGADGLLPPVTNTPELIKAAVEYGKYPPEGIRGLATVRPHNGYNMPDLKKYLVDANKRTMIFGQIETREALENCNDIIAVEGADGLFIGPIDLSVNLGIPGELSNPIP